MSENELEQPRDYAGDDGGRGPLGLGIEEAPLLALAGGIAAGALLAALLPRSRGEEKLLRPVGKRITGTAQSAVDAAREAGSSKLNELGLTRDAGAETLRSILQGAGEAARTSARAAMDAVRGDRD